MNQRKKQTNKKTRKAWRGNSEFIWKFCAYFILVVLREFWSDLCRCISRILNPVYLYGSI